MQIIHSLEIHGCFTTPWKRGRTMKTNTSWIVVIFMVWRDTWKVNDMYIYILLIPVIVKDWNDVWRINNMYICILFISVIVTDRHDSWKSIICIYTCYWLSGCAHGKMIRWKSMICIYTYHWHFAFHVNPWKWQNSTKYCFS